LPGPEFEGDAKMLLLLWKPRPRPQKFDLEARWDEGLASTLEDYIVIKPHQTVFTLCHSGGWSWAVWIVLIEKWHNLFGVIFWKTFNTDRCLRQSVRFYHSVSGIYALLLRYCDYHII